MTAELTTTVTDTIAAKSRFVTGVPDSTLKGLISSIDADPRFVHVVAVNEGAALSLAAGWYLASGEVPTVYLQNSGLGSALNPLLSLHHRRVYGLPVVMILGWRGFTEDDEPQHLPQGDATLTMLLAGGVDIVGRIDHRTSASQAIAALTKAYDRALRSQGPVVVLVTSGALDAGASLTDTGAAYLTRGEVLEAILATVSDRAVLVATTGRISRELGALRSARREAPRDLLNVGAMGHAISIALGVALAAPQVEVVCIDGDGSVLMHLGAMATVGERRPRNLVHILLDNGRHDSVDGPPTAARAVNLADLASACHYDVAEASTPEELATALAPIGPRPRPLFVRVRVVAAPLDAGIRPDRDLTIRRATFMSIVEPAESE